MRVQGEIYHWAGKGNSLAFRSTASHRLAKSTYSYKYHRYKTNTSTMHTCIRDWRATTRSTRSYYVSPCYAKYVIHTLSPWNICHRRWCWSPIAAGSVRCPRRFVRWSPSVRSRKRSRICSPRQTLRSHRSCAPVLVCRLVGA